MDNLQAGITLLTSVIQFEKRHPDYDHVVKLAKEYQDIFTGTGIATYLKKYRKNEDDDMFQQMLTIYETTIPGTVDNLDTVFEKPLRSNKVYSTIDAKSQSQRDELLDRFQKFWQGQTDRGVDAFLQERWKHDVLFDPNSFTVIEFSDFNPTKEKTTPFPIEYSSTEVYNFNYLFGLLDWLIIEQKILYKRTTGNKPEWIQGSKFIMYLENHAIVFTQVDKDTKETDKANPQFVEIKDKDDNLVEKIFVQETFETKARRVPGFRNGYKLDPVTNKRTCISNIHHALTYFKKELKSGVELDLTIRGHVFPQKYMYGPKCAGDVENSKPCKNGYGNNGEVCSICKGTGTLPIHTTAQDIIIVPLPKKGDEPILNLQQAMAYFSPPLELVKFMEEYCYRLTLKAKDAVFPSENLVQETQYQKTATELDYSWDTRYDALRKFTGRYSWSWIFIISQIAIYLDISLDDLELFHKFPSDFKFKGTKALLDEGKAAVDGDFPSHVKDAIYKDIANLLYADDQDTLTKINIKNRFMPFGGKTPEEITTILMSDQVIPFYKTLYTYFDVIFTTIDLEQGEKFYLLPYPKQLETVTKQVNDLLAKIKANTATSSRDALRNPTA